ncbi:MAG TPA: YtxH domain-containing protein [Myxococcaceae bacterium]|nr:YtxH domain-containing protein [Myxococcaceae bacterium]
MAFSDIVGGFTKSYLYTHLTRDAVKLWNRLGDGVVPHAPARRTANDITVFLLGGIVGALVGLALAPKPGVELRNEVKDKAMSLLDQARNKAQDLERATA